MGGRSRAARPAEPPERANVESLLYGLYFGRGEQLVDNHTAIFHDHPNCRSWRSTRDPGRAIARGVQRKDLRDTGGAEDRREADQPRAAALETAKIDTEAAAGDLRWTT